jgi:hypothetical protein
MQFSCHLKQCVSKKTDAKNSIDSIDSSLMFSKINVNLILTLNELHLKLIYLELIFIFCTSESRMTVD